jgi:hypothetical protein
MGPCKSREAAGTNYTHAQNITSESSGIQAESTNFMIGSNHLHFNAKVKK